MPSVLVIKVKYGDILRRFNASVNENNQLDLDVARLRAKIRSLFNLPTDANFILRYVDEDGDLVTLVNDDDLTDVMRQKLKFLSIDVHISNETGGKFNARSHGNAIPIRSPLVKNDPCVKCNNAVADVLKSLPEPLLTSTLAKFISKMIQSFLDSDSQPQVADSKISENGVPECPVASTVPEERVPQVEDEDEDVTRFVTIQISPVDHNLPCDLNPSPLINANDALVSSAVPDGDGKEREMDTFFDDYICSVSTSYAAPVNTSVMASAVSSSHTETMGGMFHKSVYCEGCGINITDWPHYKSKAKQNYHLCNMCFHGFGNETDCARVGISSLPYMGAYELVQPPFVGSPALSQFFQEGGISKHVGPMLDSRFSSDVNVIDGTMMAPCTAFTKIWRMQNNGILVWPKRTQLFWIGGHRFSDFNSVNLKIPTYGVPVDEEFDIAVDFKAPQLPGKYVSYWRMASPTGELFGQRVWVLIEVDTFLNESINDSSQVMNLKMPLGDNGFKGPKAIGINIKPTVDDASLQSCNSNSSIETEKKFSDKQDTASVVTSNKKISSVDTSFSLADKIGLLEGALLQELEEMGF